MINGFNITGAVHHSINPQTNHDEVTLDLKRLCEQMTIAGDITRFRYRLQTWMRWNEDRDFEGDYTPLASGR